MTIILLASLCLAFFALADDTLSLDVKDKAVVIHGAKGAAAWLSVSHEPSRTIGRVNVRYALALPSASAPPTISVPNGIGPRSLWAAIDTATSDVVAGTPKLFKVTLKQKGEIRDETSVIRVKAQQIEALVFRPGVGAWHYSAGDGARGDQDGVGNGEIALSVDSGEPLVSATGRAPSSLRQKDVIVIIDVPAMTIVTLAH